MADYWCECNNCRGRLITKGTWYIHNKARTRRTLTSTYNPPRARAREGPPVVETGHSGRSDVKEPSDEVDPPNDIGRASRSDSVSVMLI